MAKFRALSMSALVAMTFGCEDCDSASLIQRKDEKVSKIPYRNCPSLVKDDCSFLAEEGKRFECTYEHASRLVQAIWLRPGSKVLEVGARYGQATCQMARLLGTGTDGINPETGARLVSVDADPVVWDLLEANLARHKCHAQVVRGTIGPKSYKLITPEIRKKASDGYSKFVVDVNDPRPGVTVPAHSVQSLNVPFDTLSIDCEGCFATFLEENPDLLQNLTMIIVEVHGCRGCSEEELPPEEQMVEKLLGLGWELKHKVMDQRVLCKGECYSFCDLNWVDNHGLTYWGGTGKIAHSKLEKAPVTRQIDMAWASPEELQNLSLIELYKRARACGADFKLLSIAMDSDNPKAGLLQLLTPSISGKKV
eukprot:s1077_g15.t1